MIIQKNIYYFQKIFKVWMNFIKKSNHRMKFPHKNGQFRKLKIGTYAEIIESLSNNRTTTIPMKYITHETVNKSQ